jgi:hypothetical protein
MTWLTTNPNIVALTNKYLHIQLKQLHRQSLEHIFFRQYIYCLNCCVFRFFPKKKNIIRRKHKNVK